MWIFNYFHYEEFIDWLCVIAVQAGLFLLGEVIGKKRANVLVSQGLYSPFNPLAMIGTPIHELGHLVFAVIFRCKIQSLQFFPSRNKAVTELGKVRLGYVSYTYNKKNFIQSSGRMLIATGPIYAGILAIAIVSYFLNESRLIVAMGNIVSAAFDVSDGRMIIVYYFEHFKEIFQSIVLALFPIDLPVWEVVCSAVLILAISLHMQLSKEDMSGYIFGATVFTVIVFALCWIPEGVPYISVIMRKFSVLLLVLVCSAGVLVTVMQILALIFSILAVSFLKLVKMIF